MPSIDTARRHISTQQLRSSSHMPTIDDMKHNLTISFPNPVVNTSTASRVLGPGFQLQADEIKIEPRLRWDARSNCIIGSCREHSGNYSLEFRSLAQAEGIRDNQVHMATEVGDHYSLIFNHYSNYTA